MLLWGLFVEEACSPSTLSGGHCPAALTVAGDLKEGGWFWSDSATRGRWGALGAGSLRVLYAGAGNLSPPGQGTAETTLRELPPRFGTGGPKAGAALEGGRRDGASATDFGVSVC